MPRSVLLRPVFFSFFIFFPPPPAHPPCPFSKERTAVVASCPSPYPCPATVVVGAAVAAAAELVVASFGCRCCCFCCFLLLLFLFMLELLFLLLSLWLRPLLVQLWDILLGRRSCHLSSSSTTSFQTLPFSPLLKLLLLDGGAIFLAGHAIDICPVAPQNQWGQRPSTTTHQSIGYIQKTLTRQCHLQDYISGANARFTPY